MAATKSQIIGTTVTNLTLSWNSVPSIKVTTEEVKSVLSRVGCTSFPASLVGPLVDEVRAEFSRGLAYVKQNVEAN